MDIDKFNETFFTNPKKNAGCFSLLFMTWINSILKLGSQRTLDGDDLYPLLEEDEAQELLSELEKKWKKEIENAEKVGKRPRLWKAVLSILSVKYCIFVLTLKLLDSFGSLMLAMMLWCYLEVISQGSHMDQSYAILFILGISVAVVLKVFSLHHMAYHTTLMGMRLKIALIGLVYKKVLVSTRSGLNKITTGHIINLVSTDVQKLEQVVLGIVYCMGNPYDILSSIILLCFLVGWQSLVAILLSLIVMVYIIGMSNKFGELRKQQAQVTDKRLLAMNEIISGIRALKMFAWELNYRDRIMNIRREEVKIVQMKGTILSSFLAFTFTTRPLIALISITALVYSDVHLSASNIFTLTTILNILNSTTLHLFFYISWVVESQTAVNRMEQFVLTSSQNYCARREKEIKDGTLTDNKMQSQSSKDITRKSKVAKTYADTELPNVILPHLKVTDTSACWREEEEQCTLRGICLEATGNQLVIVTGAVGSGKSSLLMAIQGEIPIKSGRMSVLGKVAYVTQIPTMFSGTVRENILFGKPFKQQRYQKVCEVCDLQEDMRHFPKGDLSMIGERGVSLSGGQRARVSLARAVYSDANIFLLDDPLSAVDAKVGQHIFDNCICGELSGRLRILATHQLQHLRRADNIMVLSKGGVVGEGSYEDLMMSGILSNLVVDAFDKKMELRHLRTETSLNDTHRKERCSQDVEAAAEHRMVGTITWRLYWDYLRAGLPTVLIIGLFLLLVLMQVSLLIPDWWLSRMVEMSHNEQKSATTLGIYGVITAAAVVLCLLSVGLFFFSILKSSERLHDKMTFAVIKSPVLFFDTNPVGRIMNRFAKDIGTMDDVLPTTITECFMYCLNLVGVVCLSAVVNVWLLLVIIPLIVVLLYIGKYYLKSARELKRLEAIRCSPVYAHIIDTIRGLEIIHSSNRENDFLDIHLRNQNENTRAFVQVLNTSRWLGLQLDLLCAVFVIAVAIGSLAVAQQPGLAGMLLSFAIGVLTIGQYGIRQGAETESHMTSVERVITYSRLPSEPGYSRETLPPEDWPSEGAVSMRDMSLVYLENGPRVLKYINLDIQPKEKVGIAGRTGAGKSSLVAALFRMPDPQGQVFIDGIDLGTLNIQAARRAVAVIPQEPILFAGTLRKNLDPLHRFTDDEIWIALAEVQLGSTIANLDGDLEYCVGESGSGFSVGERQLVCLARALLQRCKVLVMDEATANVDFKTDQLIQEVIRHKFSSCTVLTIAHRLNTIMDYDKVIVIDQGHVVEYDKPKVLARKADGVFARLLQSYQSSNEQ